MGVPYMRATFLARRAAAGMARFTDSKNRSFSGDVFRFFFMALLRSTPVFPLNCHKSSRHPLLACKHLGSWSSFGEISVKHLPSECHAHPAGPAERCAAAQFPASAERDRSFQYGIS